VSCSAVPPRPAAGTVEAINAQRAADEALANTVYSALNANPTYYYRHVNVSVDDRVATLSGYVWSTDAIYNARKIAGQVPGITRVVTTQLELERNGRDNGGRAR
jgi:osmotically-inducible protein OsmY